MFCAKVSSKTPVNFFFLIITSYVYIKIILNVFITNLFCVSENLQYEDCFISPVSS